MILQPLFENAIKHGVYESLEPVTIRMECASNSGYLVITISNNYDAENVPRTGAGIGLKNISSRLKLIYGGDDLLSISGNEGIFSVKLRIPEKE